MTELRKPVRRRTLQPHDHRGRPLVVTLGPGDVISLREYRSRYSVSLPLREVYRHAVDLDVRHRKRQAKTRKEPSRD